jgi:hypothetical protein
MGDYAELIALGVIFALVLIVALVLRLMGIGKKKSKDAKGRKKSKGKAEKEKFYKQEAYVDQGGDGGEWEDSNMHDMKESKSKSKGMFDDMVKEKKSNKAESWDDY